MSARTLNNKSSLSTILTELRYTLSQAQAQPLGAPFVPGLQALRDDWTPLNNHEIALTEKLSDAQAQVDVADVGLDDFAGRLSKAILIITGDDRTHPLYLHYFGKKNLTEFRRPILAGQLASQKAWLPSLNASDYPSLAAMAPELDLLIKAADAAVKLKNDARQQNRQFRDVGERKLYIDKLNAFRKSMYGELSKLPYEQPGLPGDFADHFFRADNAETQDDTIESVTEKITTAKGELLVLETKLGELVKAAEKAKQDEAEAAAAQAALDALQADIAEKGKQIDAIKAKLKKK